jgi:hypothetical protein
MTAARIACAGLAAIALICSVGCGSNPPCSVVPAQVDSAKAEAKAAEAKLDIALDEKERLQQELADLEEKARQAEEAKAHEEELRRRSGRGGGQ